MTYKFRPTGINLGLPASSTVRQSAVPAGRRPVWLALEIRLTEWIKEMHGLRKPVIRILVIKKALEFEPNFMGGLFSAKAMLLS